MPVRLDRSEYARPPIEAVCLNADDGCTDGVCSLFGVSTARMKKSLRWFEDPEP